jgi:hypothetical protein
MSIMREQRCAYAERAAFRWALICVLAVGILPPVAAGSVVHHPRPAPHPAPRPVPQQIEVLFLSALDPDLPDVAAMIEQT